MSSVTFAKQIQEIMGKMVPDNLTGGLWDSKPYPHIYKEKKDNFIDGIVPEMCDIKGTYFGADKKIDYHPGAAHMNSSQAVCINFFRKFFEEQKWEEYLLDTLKAVGVPLSDAGIEYAIFEYVPDEGERTSFDFYLILSDETHISFEIKYTEPEFGGISKDKDDPGKYDRKWTNIYQRMVDGSPYLSCSKEQFYENYQINRNICHAGSSDIVLFLTPWANYMDGLNRGRAYIDSFTKSNPNIMNIYWEDIFDELMPMIADKPELLRYYTLFKKKYIDILEPVNEEGADIGRVMTRDYLLNERIPEQMEANDNGFYRIAALNYRGKCKDGTSYTEVISQWICEEIGDETAVRLFLLSGGNMRTEGEFEHSVIHRREDVKYSKGSNRNEENIAKRIFQMGNLKSADYQVPVNRISGSREGKVDLVFADGINLVIGELKDEDSNETLLRAMTEIKTYQYRIESEPTAFNRFKECYAPELKGNITPAVLLFEDEGCQPWKDYCACMNGEAVWLKRLMEWWDVKIYAVRLIKDTPDYQDRQYSVERIR